LAGEKPQIFEDHRQLEVRNFEMTQHIDKPITYVSSTINALQNIPKLGPSPHGVSMQPGEKVQMMHKNLHILFTGTKFLLVGPYLQHIIF